MKMHARAVAAPAIALAAALGFSSSAFAEIKIGVTLSTTGPAAALGVPEANMITLWPTEIGGEKLKVIVLDDAGDAGKATTNARRLVTDDKVDILLGSSTTPPSNAVGAVALETGTPHFALGPVAIPPDRMKVTFVMPQAVSLMARPLFEHMKAHNVKTLALIGFADSWGDLWLTQYKKLGAPLGIKLVTDERYARADTSVTGQALKIVSSRPDAVLVAASGSGAALPNLALRDRGYKGTIYQTHGAVSGIFPKLAGKSAEGTILVSGPAGVADLLPDGAPTKAEGLKYIAAYEAKFGKGTRTQFAAHANDAAIILERVIPVALKSARPGTPEFRAAILKALESEKNIVASQGVYTFTPTDHEGLDTRAYTLITVKDGKFAAMK